MSSIYPRKENGSQKRMYLLHCRAEALFITVWLIAWSHVGHDYRSEPYGKTSSYYVLMEWLQLLGWNLCFWLRVLAVRRWGGPCYTAYGNGGGTGIGQGSIFFNLTAAVRLLNMGDLLQMIPEKSANYNMMFWVGIEVTFETTLLYPWWRLFVLSFSVTWAQTFYWGS
jgi:hypothetical protein